MRGKAAIVACVGAALLAVGCNPLAERRYVNEGAGANLYTADSAAQVELLNAYTDYICAQVGSGCGNWSTFVIAGMNDIDQRCDGFLTWLDGKRRDREPVLAELSAVNTAVHTIMTVTGSSPQSLNILTAAFGLASATYANWNSRLLISVEQSTVQAVVYKSQGDYREKIKTWPVPDRPSAIYLLRNYLRTCMPMNIEASINTSTTLVQREAPREAMQNLVVQNVAPPVRVKFTPVANIGTRIMAFFNASSTNQQKVEAWLNQNANGMPIAFFIRSGNSTAQQKMASDLRIP